MKERRRRTIVVPFVVPEAEVGQMDCVTEMMMENTTTQTMSRSTVTPSAIFVNAPLAFSSKMRAMIAEGEEMHMSEAISACCANWHDSESSIPEIKGSMGRSAHVIMNVPRKRPK